MSPRRLRWIYGLLVGGLLLWPFAHFGLTHALGSNPWKNFGLAMYVVHHDTRVVLRVREEGRWRNVERPHRSLPPSVRREIRAFRDALQTRGRIASASELARAMAALERFAELEVVVVTERLRPNGELRRTARRHSRHGLGGGHPPDDPRSRDRAGRRAPAI